MDAAPWSLYGLRLSTPRLELRLPELSELEDLARLAAEGVHDPAEMPFLTPWSLLPPPERAIAVMRFHWRQLAGWTPEDWHLQFVVFAAGCVVGTQSIAARDFAATRTVRTGSWLGRRHQGQGIGTEMRAAVLHLAFDGLDAESAITAALTDGGASGAVSRRLGYHRNGVSRVCVLGACCDQQHFELDRDRWLRHRTVPVEISELAPHLPHFGL